MNTVVLSQTADLSTPRLGFLGVGWIGRNRMAAIQASGAGSVSAIAEPSPEAAAAALQEAPEALTVQSFEELLELDLDGVVVATPSAMHVEQAVRALERGFPVFVQKPLGRTRAETLRVIDAARAADRLLGVDLSYRHTAALQCLRELIQNGDLGDIFSVDLTFHNAYGPDKPWYFDPTLSGGGCVLDLGIHLVDVAYHVLGARPLETVSSTLLHAGKLFDPSANVVEDFAVATLEHENGPVVRLACSWNLNAGHDAVIEASFYGTNGGARFRNVKGSFYDFVAEKFRGTWCERLIEPPDDWQGRAAEAWARKLASDRSYDPEIEQLLPVANALDRILNR